MGGAPDIAVGAFAVLATALIIRHARQARPAPDRVVVPGRFSRRVTTRIRRRSGPEAAPAAEPGGDLVAWRFGRLLAAGVDIDLALRMAAEQAIDLHAVLGLLDDGCPADLAARIAQPLAAIRPEWTSGS